MKKQLQPQLSNIIDVHSHILFDIDDGPDAVEDSLKILELQKHQNVSDIILTPHFYADTDDFDKFIALRQQRFEQLKKANTTGINLYLGSEVFLCKELLLLDSIDDLCINGTNRILLEIPYDAEINDYLMNMINQIISNYSVIPILAHIDRYFSYIKYYRYVVDELIELGCELQLNADALLQRKKAKEARKMLDNGCITYIGSDTHNTGARKPRISDAYKIISSLYGSDIASFFNEKAADLL